VTYKLEMRFSTTTTSESAFTPWQERAENIEALVKYAQVRILVTVLNPTYTVSIHELSVYFDVPDIVEGGVIDTVATGTATATFQKTFNAIPKLTATVIPARAGYEIFINNKTAVCFEIEVKNAGARVVRAVEYTAIGY